MADQAVTPGKSSAFTIFVTLLVLVLMVLLCLLAQRGENRVFVQALVGVTLVSGFGYGWVDRVRGMHPRLRESEVLLASSTARLIEGIVPVDGLLTLTDQRLVFSPLWPGPVIEIPRGGPTRAQIMGRACLWLRAHQAEYTFEIQNPHEWAQLIKTIPLTSPTP